MENEKIFLDKINTFNNFHMPRWKDLPEIDLYMDQVISVTDKYLSVMAVSDDPVLTPSMINNYVKNRILPPPVKKKYSREHLAKLLVICILKPVMEISAIADIMERSEKLFGIERMLDDFSAMFETRLSSLSHDISEAFEKEEKTEEMLCAITIENAVRSGTEKIIANFAYSAFGKKETDEKEKEKEKAEKKKEEKPEKE
ncbi:MAG: DUF1836 domain-containing protein [Ruminococcaceae bacterium]|nr:DUF1836 domain-containing protein [Oscillospiraceae bacterium]MBO5006159.1 DUF1836 domain-containing protein [Clostridia bacterium]